MCKVLPLATSQMRAVLSSPPAVTIYLPSGENATESTLPVCPEKICAVSPLATSHRRAVLSVLPVSRYLPSGEKTTSPSSPVCPEKMRIVSPVATSQSLAVLSLLPVARYLPSGEKATPHRRRVWPLNSSGGASTAEEASGVGLVGRTSVVGAEATVNGIGVDPTSGVQAVIAMIRTNARTIK